MNIIEPKSEDRRCEECGTKANKYVGVGFTTVCFSCIKKARRLVSEHSVDKDITKPEDIKNSNEI